MDMNDIADIEIDGSKAVGIHETGDEPATVETEDGRMWRWHNTSYIDSDSHRLIPEGEWIEA